MDLEFDAELWEWRGPAPFFWLSLPEDGCERIRVDAEQASYGWGAVPVEARIGETTWETSLLPKAGGYALPVKQAVRRAERIDLGDTVAVELTVVPPWWPPGQRHRPHLLLTALPCTDDFRATTYGRPPSSR